MTKEDSQEQLPNGYKRLADGTIVHDADDFLNRYSQKEIDDELKRNPVSGARSSGSLDGSLPKRHSEPSHSHGPGSAEALDINYQGTNQPSISRFSKRPKN